MKKISKAMSVLLSALLLGSSVFSASVYAVSDTPADTEDNLSWLPYTEEDYEKFTAEYTTVACVNGYIVLAEDPAWDGGFDIFESREGDAEYELVKQYNVRSLPEDVCGGSSLPVKVYKPTKVGKMIITWTKMRDWEGPESAVWQKVGYYIVGRNEAGEFTVNEVSKDDYAVTDPIDYTVGGVFKLNESSDKGDINPDGIIDITDLSVLSFSLIGDKELTPSQQKAADVDDDSAVTLADLAKLRQYLSKKIVSLDDTSAPAPDAYNFKDHYIRIQSVINGETPQKYMFETASDFRSFLEKNEEMVTQSKQHPSEMNLEDAQKKYDDKWFENHDLIMVLLQEGSGSIRHSVTSIDTQMIKIMQRIPEVGTADMAGWAILIELNKGSKIDINKVKVVLNEEMACSTTE